MTEYTYKDLKSVVKYDRGWLFIDDISISLLDVSKVDTTYHSDGDTLLCLNFRSEREDFHTYIKSHYTIECYYPGLLEFIVDAIIDANKRSTTLGGL